MLTTVAIYAPHVASASFVYEDTNDFNTLYRTDGWRAHLREVVDRPSRALSTLTFRAIGPDPHLQHAFNLALHLANGLLVWAVAAWLLSPWAGVVAAGLFWLHPLNVEAVAYASARPDLLLALFALLGLLAAVSNHRWVMLAAAFGALAAKESGALVWVLLPLAAWWAGRVWPCRWRMAWAALIGFPTAAALSTFTPGSQWKPSWDAFETSLPQAWAMLSRVVWPVGFTVLPDAAWVTSTATDVALTATTVLLLWAIADTAFSFPSTMGAWVTLSVAVLVLPRLVLPLAEGLHEHHLYLPMAFVAMLAARRFTKGTLHLYGTSRY